MNTFAPRGSAPFQGNFVRRPAPGSAMTRQLHVVYGVLIWIEIRLYDTLVLRNYDDRFIIIMYNEHRE